jgi:hypothetical protein
VSSLTVTTRSAAPRGAIQGERHLRHHQAGAESAPAPPGGDATPFPPERVGRIAAREGERREHGEAQSDPDGYQQGEREGRAVHCDLVDPRDPPRPQGEQQVHPPRCKEEPQHPAPEGEEHALDQHLSRQPPAARAQGRTDRELPLTDSRPGEEKIGDVGTGDEQHEERRAAQDQQTPAGPCLPCRWRVGPPTPRPVLPAGFSRSS